MSSPATATILEIGGGYGNFCRLLMKRGFAGSYVIYDLPEFLQLQEWYLGRTLAPDERKQVTFTTSLPDSAADARSSACGRSARCRSSCATASRRWRRNISSSAISRNSSVSTTSTTSSAGSEDEDYRWIHVAIPHIKDNYYLFGARK